jgi:hypothetical protein
MVEYSCDKCHKQFHQKSNYLAHINRKNPCDQVDPICEYCDKKFCRKSYLKEHIEKCKLKKDKHNTDNILSGNSDFVNYNNISKSTINTTKNTINIIINPFLSDDMSKLTDKQKTNILKKCYESIPELIRQVNFNPDMPENHNVYISNIKSSYGHINDGKKWIITKVDNLINDLISKKKDDIEDLLEEFADQLPEKVIDKIRDVIASIEYDPMADDVKDKDKMKFKKRVLDEVKMLLYNNKEIPQATREKSKKIESSNKLKSK